MDFTQNFIFITSYYIYFKLLIMLIESGILLENHVSCNLPHSFFSTICENFKSVFYWSSGNKNLETCMQVWFEQFKELTNF